MLLQLCLLRAHGLLQHCLSIRALSSHWTNGLWALTNKLLSIIFSRRGGGGGGGGGGEGGGVTCLKPCGQLSCPS